SDRTCGLSLLLVGRHGMRLEELPNARRRLRGPVVVVVFFAVFDNSGVATHAIEFAPVTGVLAAAIVLHPRVALLSCLLDRDEWILPAVLNEHGHTAPRRARDGDATAAHRRDGGEAVGHRTPQQVAEEGAVGKAGCEH